jgi:recombination protein RecA
MEKVTMSELTPKQVVAGIRKKHGDDSAMLMGGTGTGVKAVCPTGIGVIDNWVVGIGGLPYGRIIEVYGAESSGKTTIADVIMAGCQRDNGIAALLETEQSFDPAWAKIHGVDIDNLVFCQPNYLSAGKKDDGGGALQQIESIVERSSASRPIVVVLDSVAATCTQGEYDDGLSGHAAMAEQARDWSAGLRTLNKVISKHQAMLVLVNQVRAKPGVMFGPTETTTGGNAIKFYSSIRLQCSHGKQIEGGNGRYMRIKAMKNKLCPPYRGAELRLDYATGFNETWNTLNYAKEVGCVEKSTRLGRKGYIEACEALGWNPVAESNETIEQPDIVAPIAEGDSDE